jgi:hypothetical protein
MTKEITVRAVPVGDGPREYSVAGTRAGQWLRDFVDGALGIESIGHSLCVVSNDNGLGLRLPYNRSGFVGNFAIVKISSAGNSTSMRKKDIANASEWLKRNEHVPPLCHVCGGPGGATLFCVCLDVLVFCPACYDQLGDEMSPTQARRFGLCARCRGRSV